MLPQYNVCNVSRNYVFVRVFFYLILSIYSITAKSADHAVILQYHHVSDNTPYATSITVQQFTAHLNWLEDNRFQVWPLPDIINLLQQSKSLPDKVVAISFDDGFHDIYDNAFPLLKKRKWPFTVFLNTEPVDKGYKSHMNWQQIKELHQVGATIANHTATHPFMVRQRENENTQQWLLRLKKEIHTAKQLIQQHTGNTEKLLAYPYGESTQQVRNLILQLGYVGFGQQSGPIGSYSDFSNLPRFPLSGRYTDLTEFAQKMYSLPMPVIHIQKNTDLNRGILSFTENRPELELTLGNSSYLPEHIDCFATEQGKIKVEKKANNTFRITPKQAIPVGRSRYNCTAPSNQAGRYYWYSHQWIRLEKDNRWQHE